MRLIGLTGPTGSGKDTVAKFLCDTQGFVQIAFADPMRDGLKAMFGLTDEDFSDRVKKETLIPWMGVSPRELLNGVGQWGRDNIDEELWILTLARRRLKDVRNASPSLHINGLVVTDIRLELEARWLRREEGELWHIHRTTLAYTGLASNVRPNVYESGVEWQEGDRIIHNAGSIDVLYETLGNLLTEAS